MFQLKNVLVLAAGALFAAGLSACDSDDDDDDDGDGGSDDTPVYSVLKITDLDKTDDNDGTSGADFCSIQIKCGADGKAVSGTASLKVGTGVCTETVKTHCETSGNRYDDVSRLKFDESNKCEKALDVVSIGIDGVLTVTYQDNLAGCDAVIDEYTPANKDKEKYQVEICTADGKCLTAKPNPATGGFSAKLPTAAAADAE